MTHNLGRGSADSAGWNEGNEERVKLFVIENWREHKPGRKAFLGLAAETSGASGVCPLTVPAHSAIKMAHKTNRVASYDSARFMVPSSSWVV